MALQVAEALVAVKEAHLVHRDIKPSNLMLTPRGDVKVIDFGLTKSNANGQIDGVGQITLNGFMGSSDYASPEQLNEEPLEVTSDMYSLGVTLWFLLTGRRPFRGPQVKGDVGSPEQSASVRGTLRVSDLDRELARAHAWKKIPRAVRPAPLNWSLKSAVAWKL